MSAAREVSSDGQKLTSATPVAPEDHNIDEWLHINWNADTCNWEDSIRWSSPMDSKENKCKYADEEEEVSMVTSKKWRASGDGNSSSSEEEFSSEEEPTQQPRSDDGDTTDSENDDDDCHTRFLKPKPDAHRMYAQDQVVIHTVRM
jgi:hypothetical protein